MSEHTHPQSGHPFPHPVTLIHTDADDRPLVIPGHGPDFHLTADDIETLARFRLDEEYEEPFIGAAARQWLRDATRSIDVAKNILANPDALRAYLDGAKRAERYRAERDAAIAGLKEARAMFANVRAALAPPEGPSE